MSNYVSVFFTVKRLNRSNVVVAQLEIRFVALVDGRHEGPFDFRMTESQGVSKLVGGYDHQIGSVVHSVGPMLLLVEMSVAGFRIECMS